MKVPKPEILTLLPSRRLSRMIAKTASTTSPAFLRADRVNDQYRLHRSDLLERTSSREIDIPAHVFEAPRSAGVSVPRLADALRAGGIFYGVCWATIRRP